MAYDFYNPYMGDVPQDIIHNVYGGYSKIPEIRNTEDYYRTSLAAQNSMAQRTAMDNEMAKAAEWAQHLQPETLAGLNIGNILGKVLLPSVAQATQNWGNKLYGTLFGKKNNNSQQTVNSDAIRKGVTAAADKMFGIPNVLGNLGQDYTNPYGDTISQKEIKQPWTTDVNEMLNPISKQNNPLLFSLQKPPSLGYSNFNVSNPSTNLNLDEQYNNPNALVNRQKFAGLPPKASLNFLPVSNFQAANLFDKNYSPTYPSTYKLPNVNLGIDYYNSYFRPAMKSQGEILAGT